TWADYSISGQFIGQKNFQTLSVKAQILTAQGKQDQADAIMKEALPMGEMNDIHQYPRQLIPQKRAKDAFDAFKMNYAKHPNTFTTKMGMARAYSATGDYKKAQEYLKKAYAQVPDPGNKVNIEKMMPMLDQGKDIN